MDYSFLVAIKVRDSFHFDVVSDMHYDMFKGIKGHQDMYRYKCI